LRDRFHPCGSQDYLDRMFGLDTDSITEALVADRWDH
jgi:transketolase